MPRHSTKPGNHPASKLLNEFLLGQNRHCWALLTKGAFERVRNAISNSVDTLLEADEFLLDFK